MRLIGKITELGIDLDEHDFVVKEAIVTADRIAIDWTEYDAPFSLVAHSENNGQTYTGNYGIDKPNNNCVMEITRYSGPNKSILLLAKWYESDSGRTGSSLIVLKREA